MNRWLFLQNTSYYFIFPHKTATQFFSYFSNNSHNAYKNVGGYSKFNITKLSVWKLIKSILIHEYQHESTRINTGQHESNTSQHESTQINTSPTRVQHESTQVRHESTRINTSQHDSNTSQHEATRVQNRSRPWKRDKHGSKKRQNLAERCCGRLHLSGFRFLLKIYDQLNY